VSVREQLPGKGNPPVLSFRGQLSDCVECWIIHDAPPFSVMELPEDFRRAHLASLGRTFASHGSFRRAHLASLGRTFASHASFRRAHLASLGRTFASHGSFRRAPLASLGRGLSPYIRQTASASPCKHGKQRFLRMHGSMLTRKKMLVLAD